MRKTTTAALQRKYLQSVLTFRIRLVYESSPSWKSTVLQSWAVQSAGLAWLLWRQCYEDWLQGPQVYALNLAITNGIREIYLPKLYIQDYYSSNEFVFFFCPHLVWFVKFSADQWISLLQTRLISASDLGEWKVKSELLELEWQWLIYNNFKRNYVMAIAVIMLTKKAILKENHSVCVVYFVHIVLVTHLGV
jgi:hypothetical protein